MINFFKRKVLFLFLFALLVFIVGCSTQYEVTFIDYDNTIIEVVTVKKGEATSIPIDPSREGHIFVGWDKDFNNIKSNLEIKANYEILTYEVVFKNEDDTVIKSVQVEHGKDAIAPTVNVSEGVTLTWDKEFTNITQNLEIKAIHLLSTYQVRFLDHDGAVIKSEVVIHGSNAISPSDPVRYNYDFLNWSVPYDNIKEDLDVFAVYSVEKNPLFL